MTLVLALILVHKCSQLQFHKVFVAFTKGADMNFLARTDFNKLTDIQRVEWFRRTNDAWCAFIDGGGSDADYEKLQIHYQEILDEVRNECR
jgi:hypothetical protein